MVQVHDFGWERITAIGAWFILRGKNHFPNAFSTNMHRAATSCSLQCDVMFVAGGYLFTPVLFPILCTGHFFTTSH
jgi:hypothetical protein